MKPFPTTISLTSFEIPALRKALANSAHVVVLVQVPTSDPAG